MTVSGIGVGDLSLHCGIKSDLGLQKVGYHCIKMLLPIENLFSHPLGEEIMHVFNATNEACLRSDTFHH